tara:strand:- start:7577 stop:8233 length:657 start_codon:yes stop_codon:yes gene_type:complete
MPDKPGKIMKYYELSGCDGSQILNRVEQFSDSFTAVDALLTGGVISELVKLVAGITPSLFKEKINFKMPGGGGFNVHQDAPAFTRFIHDELIVVMIPVDETNHENGCLQVADNFFENKIIPHVGGTVEAAHLSAVTWRSINMNPSDVLVFSSWLLHKSDKNTSSAPRRNYFVTYNDLQHGEMREEYFEFKRINFPPLVEREPGVDYQKWTSKLSKIIL